jgi:nucleoside-diphosphate-sugar epimerase
VPRDIFITGGTGYIGSRLIPLLTARSHRVRALVRPGSERKLPPGATPVSGNPLDESSFASNLRPTDTFIQLVGVPHPSPAKAREFREIDLVSAKASIHAAAQTRVEHFIYLSVAQPAPVMKVYQEVRAEAERLLRETALPATILRPWYVLGPGHRWPILIAPIYWIAERIPSTREGAQRLGFVTIHEMLSAIVKAAEEPPVNGAWIWDVPAIRRAAGFRREP